MELITIKDDLLNPYYVKFDGTNFDIFRMKTSKRLDKVNGKPTGETYEREVGCGSAGSIESCIEKIIRLRLLAKHKKVMSLIDFYKNYREIKEEVSVAFKLDNYTQLEKRLLILEDKHKNGGALIVK